MKYAEQLYLFEAKEVNIFGTNKRERFDIKRLENGDVHIKVYHVDKNRSIIRSHYERLFKKSETKEIRCYGLGQNDIFNISGTAKKSILIRIIGGEGDDQIIDTAKVINGKKTLAYDQKNGINIQGNGVKNKTSNSVTVNRVERNQFQYNTYLPIPYLGINIDDGFSLGAGITFTDHSFRKTPYARKQNIKFSYAMKSKAFNISYTGDFVDLLGTLDFNPTVSYENPTFFNYFGKGNETTITNKSISYNQVPLEIIRIAPLLKQTWHKEKVDIRFGPFFESIEMGTRDNRITDDPNLGFSKEIFKEVNYTGLEWSSSISTIDNSIRSRDGIQLELNSGYRYNLTDKNNSAWIGGHFSGFLTLSHQAEITLGARTGFEKLFGDQVYFYNLQTLGGNNFLRGYRKDRFSGHTLVYNNFDIRVKLFYWKNHVFPMDIGLMTGYDIGRVWWQNDPSKKWHQSFSNGIWVAPFKVAVVSAYYSFTDRLDKNNFTVQLGFFF